MKKLYDPESEPKISKTKNKFGFTLIELLIVVAILGLLASIVLVGMGGARARARDARRISDLRETQNALELYYSATGYYPNVLANLTGGNPDIGIKKLPKDPSSNSDYAYVVNGNNNSTHYVLGANLEQKNPALVDDIDNVDLVNYGVAGIFCDDSGVDLYYCVGL